MKNVLHRQLKGMYKTYTRVTLALFRKMLLQYYPVLLGYPHHPEVRWGHGKPPHPELYTLLNRSRDSYRELLSSFQQYEAQLSMIPLTDPKSDEDPSWLNGWLPAFDGLGIYGCISNLKPSLFIEIGSGNSTKFARRAIRDQGLNTKITSIDPYPRAEINSLCDTIIRKPLQDADLIIFDKLESGDVLYVDGSHYCLQNSDVTVIFLELLPKLKSGVIVEFHDIFLPYDYHPEWKERYYSEQYMLATALLLGDRFDVMLPNAFISEDKELSDVIAPLMDKLNMPQNQKHGGSFWMRVK